MEAILKILIPIGVILLALYSKKKRENKQKSDEPIFDNQGVIEPEDIFPQWDEEVLEEEHVAEEIQPASLLETASSLEKTIEAKSPSKTELPLREEVEKTKEPKEEEPTVATIAGMPLNSENIRYGIIFSEILKRREVKNG